MRGGALWRGQRLLVEVQFTETLALWRYRYHRKTTKGDNSCGVELA